MNLMELRRAIAQTLAYSDVFDTPLTAVEIQRYLTGLPASLEQVQAALDAPAGLYGAQGGYITLPGRGGLADTRNRRLQMAARLWPVALYWGRVIARLPFIRMVAVTGALAVSNVEAGADIDYLLVTEPGRLWLGRALALLAGRAARLVHGVSLCPNYIVTLDTLEFPDRNLYAARELAQMAPLSGPEVYAEIRRCNAWVEDYLPNAQQAPPGLDFTTRRAAAPGRLQRSLEGVLRLPAFTRLEQWEMRRKIQRLEQEQPAGAESLFNAGVCKGHSQRHQGRTRQAFEQRLQQMDVHPPHPVGHIPG